MNGQQRVIIENVQPLINCGEFPVKRVLNDTIRVEADIFCDSHDVVIAELSWKHSKDDKSETKEMHYDINDRWYGSFKLSRTGTWHFSIQAWADQFRSWHRDIKKKIDASSDYEVDILTGAEIIRSGLEEYPGMDHEDKAFLNEAVNSFSSGSGQAKDKISLILDGSLYDIMVKYPVKKHISRTEEEPEVEVERSRAGFSSWYEVFPRSLGYGEKRHGSLADCIDFLPYISEMGFDVMYLPPIHPVGKTNRKGKNNSTVSEPGDPGSPWAIGSEEGGHKSIHPELGDHEDLRTLVKKAADYGIELALDIAFQCSPDHPWVKEHPQWFMIRPDGSLQYAENPPKKYEDIYPLNFETDDWKALWEELKSVFLHWIDHGIKIFRVDNPHTKSLRFWGWVIEEIKKEHDDIILLSEAFTRPKLMYQLAKQGFSQSYTYFTWRNTKYEISTYCQELVNTETREFFRPCFWPNTPDILPEYLQLAPRPGFIQRIALAATLSSNYGIYGPAFELMENKPVAPGKEEYLNSEKYEIKNWDIRDPQSLKSIIKRINKIRNENRALQNTHSLKFHDIDNEAMICYSKTSDDLENIILVVVNLDPHHTHSGWISFPPEEFLMDKHVPFQVHDLLSGSFFMWSGEQNYVEIDPGVMPLHIFKVRRKVRSEKDFDYFM
ncbi:MAG: alpha-1,4-glucan--maltose-1-phosphate maltosyltransferase [Bacteroidales bacterium]